MKGGRCTNCGSQLERGFGLVNCLRCGTLLFIDLEGQVEKAEANQVQSLEPSDPPPPAIHVPFEDPVAAEEPGFMISPQEELSLEAKSGAKPPPLKGKIQPAIVPPTPSVRSSGVKRREEAEGRARQETRSRLPVTSDATRVVRLSTEALEPSPQVSRSEPNDFPQGFEALPTVEGNIVDGKGAVDFLKGRSPAGEGLDAVRNFGNSDLSQGQDGAVYFDVVISGVDSKKIRDELRDCLTDRRFLWDVDELIKSIRKGELKLQGLSAVKASVVLARLKELPVGLKWLQTGLMEVKQEEPAP